MKTKVCFRKFPEDDIIALFPEIVESRDGLMISSYMHVGQHCSASKELIQDLPIATPEQYGKLEKELLSIGYVLEIED